MILNFSVENQRLIRKDDSYLVERSTKYHSCKFSFTDDWDGLTKVALFLPVNDTGPIPVVIADDGTCQIPKKITYYGGQCKLAVIGGSETDIVNVIDGNDADGMIISTNVYRLSFDETIHIDEITEDEEIKNPFFEYLNQVKQLSADLKNYQNSIDEALDAIIAIDNELIGGGSE